MKKRIMELFNSLFEEAPVRGADYYRSMGYEFSDDEPLPEGEKFTLNDTGEAILLGGIYNLFPDISKIVENGDYADAFIAYGLIMRESAKALEKADELFIKPLELINELLLITYESRKGIADLLKDCKDVEFIISVLEWLKVEILRKEYIHNRHYWALSDLFIDLCSCNQVFSELAEKFISEPSETKPLPYEYLKLGFYFCKGKYKYTDQIVAANSLEFDLRKYHIELHHRNDRNDDALEYAMRYLREASTEVKKGFKLSIAERIKSYPGYELAEMSFFCNWCLKFILELLLELKQFNRAIDYVSSLFLGDEYGEKSDRYISMEIYGLLQKSLPEGRKKELPQKLFARADQLPLYTIRDLCEFEGFWLPMIDSFKASKKLYDVLKIYKENKENLRIFPEEMIEALCIVIMKYIETGSASDRKETIKEGLGELYLLKESKPSIFKLIYNIKKNYRKRKILLDTLDEFINANSLGNEYEEYTRQQQEIHAANEMIVKSSGKKINKNSWSNPDWITYVNARLQEKLYLHELIRMLDISDDIAEIPEDTRIQLLVELRNAVITFIGTSNQIERIKAEKAIEALKVIKKIDIQGDALFEAILALQMRYKKKELLNLMLNEYLSEANLSDGMNRFRNENEARLFEKYHSEKQNLTSKAKEQQKKSSWNDNEWAVNKITELRSLKSIFELKKRLPSDASIFNHEQRKQLMNIYHESIHYYAAVSKKDEATKARNIIEALKNVKNTFGDESFVRQMVSELKNRYPKRIRFNEMLDKEFIES